MPFQLPALSLYSTRSQPFTRFHGSAATPLGRLQNASLAVVVLAIAKCVVPTPVTLTASPRGVAPGPPAVRSTSPARTPGRSGCKSACESANSTRILALLYSRDAAKAALSPTCPLRMISIGSAPPATKGSCSLVTPSELALPIMPLKVCVEMLLHEPLGKQGGEGGRAPPQLALAIVNFWQVLLLVAFGGSQPPFALGT